MYIYTSQIDYNLKSFKTAHPGRFYISLFYKRKDKVQKC